MPVADAVLVNQIGNLKIAEEKILPHLEQAEVKLRKLLGTVYDEIVTITEPYTQADLNQLKKAEAYATLSSLILSIVNISAGEGGITRAGGWGDSRFELISYNEAKIMSRDYWDRAVSLIKDYIISEDEDITNLGSISLWVI